ncbi:hypothetical protein [Nocardioides sp.]|uniref:hypothetical protein n=1 Tax=Nocardioides sp. TaxID=35761 RepID=UPI003511DEFC
MAPARRVAAPLATVIGLALITGCSGSDSSADPDRVLPEAGGDASAQAPAPDTVVAGTLTGMLGERRRADAVAGAGRVVTTWFAALGAPAQDPGRYVGFTRRARELAVRDRVLRALSAPDGPATVRIDLLGRDAHAVGATARVRLPLARGGDLVGSLYLTPHAGTADGWRIFGFDLTRSQEAR